jgi:hypothetical protein
LRPVIQASKPERAVQRFGLAQGAAGVGVELVQRAVGVFEIHAPGVARMVRMSVRPSRLGQLALIGQRFGKQHLRVDEQHRRLRSITEIMCSSTTDSAPKDDTSATPHLGILAAHVPAPRSRRGGGSGRSAPPRGRRHASVEVSRGILRAFRGRARP